MTESFKDIVILSVLTLINISGLVLGSLGLLIVWTLLIKVIISGNFWKLFDIV